MSEYLEKILPDIIKENPNLKFLEIGVGSGINLETAKKSGVKKENILGTDINPEAVKHCKEQGFNCIQSDLFNKVKGKFDLIVFNPPYLPLDEKELLKSRLETTGGKKGNEISIEFLRQAKKYLRKYGKVILITSSLSENIDFEELVFKSKKIEEKKLFYEKLALWECWLKKLAKPL